MDEIERLKDHIKTLQELREFDREKIRKLVQENDWFRKKHPPCSYCGEFQTHSFGCASGRVL